MQTKLPYAPAAIGDAECNRPRGEPFFGIETDFRKWTFGEPVFTNGEAGQSASSWRLD